jgi:hypothetical protein
VLGTGEGTKRRAKGMNERVENEEKTYNVECLRMSRAFQSYKAAGAGQGVCVETF